MLYAGCFLLESMLFFCCPIVVCWSLADLILSACHSVSGGGGLSPMSLPVSEPVSAVNRVAVSLLLQKKILILVCLLILLAIVVIIIAVTVPKG